MAELPIKGLPNERAIADRILIVLEERRCPDVVRDGWWDLSLLWPQPALEIPMRPLAHRQLRPRPRRTLKRKSPTMS
jgi:hypothetical protein